MTEIAWIDAALSAARPQALGALLRYFRNLNLAEEAYQEASRQAFVRWLRNGPPRDRAAWLLFVGRNVSLDAVRRRSTPNEGALGGAGLVGGADGADGAERSLADRLDGTHYRDDVLRLLFLCSHPDLPATQQIALTLQVVCGFSIKQIARIFLTSESTIEQRITRARVRVVQIGIPSEVPAPDSLDSFDSSDSPDSAAERPAALRAERLAAVAAVLSLMFDEGYSARGDAVKARVPLCNEAIRLVRVLLRLFPSEPELLGLAALFVLEQARGPARLDGDGASILLEDQDRTRWDPALSAEGFALIDKAMRHKQPGPYQVQASIAALHARAPRPEDTDWARIERLYASLEGLPPSRLSARRRAVAVSKGMGRRRRLL